MVAQAVARVVQAVIFSHFLDTKKKKKVSVMKAEKKTHTQKMLLCGFVFTRG